MRNFTRPAAGFSAVWTFPCERFFAPAFVLGARPGGAEFVPDLIHNQSGVGSDAFAGDINRDGRMDVLTSTKFGTFVFWGQAPAR